MKTNAIIRIVLFSLTIVLLAGILLVGMGFSYLSPIFSKTTDAGETVVNGETVCVDTADIRKINIEWAAGDIIVEPREDIDQIQFSETAAQKAKYAMVYSVSGSKLTISFCKDSIKFGFNNTSITKDLTVYIPADWICDELQLEVAAANVDVRNLTVGTVNFDGASGTCNFENCIVDNLDMDTASGDVTFTGELGSLDFDAASASFNGTLTNCPRKIDMDGMSGDLDLTLPADSGFTVDMDGMSSNFRCEFEYAQRGDGTYVSGDGSCRIDVDGMSCDVYIRKGE